MFQKLSHEKLSNAASLVLTVSLGLSIKLDTALTLFFPEVPLRPKHHLVHHHKRDVSKTVGGLGLVVNNQEVKQEVNQVSGSHSHIHYPALFINLRRAED